MVINQVFWKNKKVLITGHTGFKGAWLSLWLQNLGAKVIGISLDSPTTPSLYEQANVAKGMISLRQDIRNGEAIKQLFQQYKPEIVLHLAAQPLVRYSYREPVETYETNVMGTLHILEGIRSIDSVRSAVMITTDKCYQNKEWVWGYRETDALGGHDPYSSSKGCAELVISAYRHSFLQEQGIGLASVRAGNVIGGGDWAEDRLIPDILRSFEKNKPVVIRNPKATRPWQHVLEPLSGYLVLAQKLYNDQDQYAEGWNFGPNEQDVKSVDWILDKMISKWPNSSWVLDSNHNPYEADFLKLDISKAKYKLGWKPTWELDHTLDKIVNWHRSWLNKEDMQTICLTEIEEYTQDMK